MCKLVALVPVAPSDMSESQLRVTLHETADLHDPPKGRCESGFQFRIDRDDKLPIRQSIDGCSQRARVLKNVRVLFLFARWHGGCIESLLDGFKDCDPSVSQ